MSRPIRLILVLCAAAAAASCSQNGEPPETAEPSAPAKRADNSTDVARQEAESNGQGQPAVDAESDSQTAAETPTAEAILRRLSATYQAARTIQVQSEAVIHMEAQGMDNRMSATTEIAAEKPNRLAMRSDSEFMGMDIVSDGKTLFMHVPMLKKYSESTAPESFAELSDNPVISMGGGGGSGNFAMNLLLENPYEAIMDDVDSAEYVGPTELDGKRVHHLKFTQDQFDWEAWIDAGEQPLVYRVAVDMSKAMQQMPGGGMPDMKMSMVQNFRDWKFDEPIDEEAFAFVAPEGAEKTDDLFDMGGGEEELSPLLGQAAPAVELELLDGGKLSLAEHKDKDIVVLDFWATWCGPCVAAMPKLIEATGDYASKGVAFYAVNLQEGADEIRQFLNDEELNVVVALDSDGTAAESYGVAGIPTTVLIDKNGTVQSVHVGYDPDIKNVLSQEFDDLLAGKNIAEQKIKEHEQRQAEEASSAPPPEGLNLVWSHQAAYSGVAVDDTKKAIYALRRGDQCDLFNPSGERERTFQISGGATTLRSARLSAEGDAALLAFKTWGGDVRVFQADGTPLWTEANEQGVNDVWAADLDGDQLDEVIIGYNGDGGLHVFSQDGTRRWQENRIGNVWHVCAGDVTGDAGIEVVSTSANGSVHIFSAGGEELDTLSAPLYANMVRVGRVAANAKSATIFAAGQGENATSLVALDNDARVQFLIDFPAGYDHVASMAVCPTRPWLAVALRGGLVVVIDAAEAKIIAQASRQGRNDPHVAWSTPESSSAPLLLVAAGRSLNAFEVAPGEAAEAGEAAGSEGEEEPPGEDEKSAEQESPGGE